MSNNPEFKSHEQQYEEMVSHPRYRQHAREVADINEVNNLLGKGWRISAIAERAGNAGPFIYCMRFTPKTSTSREYLDQLFQEAESRSANTKTEDSRQHHARPLPHGHAEKPQQG